MKGILPSLSSCSATSRGLGKFQLYQSMLIYMGEPFAICSALLPMIAAFSYFDIQGFVILTQLGSEKGIQSSIISMHEWLLLSICISSSSSLYWLSLDECESWSSCLMLSSSSYRSAELWSEGVPSQSSSSSLQSSPSQSGCQLAIVLQYLVLIDQNYQLTLIGYQQQHMGNCHKRDEDLAATNFDDEKWCTINTHIYPQCFLLKNYYHPNVKLFKWISSQTKQNKISQWRLRKKTDYLVNVYEAGETRTAHDYNKQIRAFNTEKRPYIVTEELIRLKDLTLTENQAAIIAYRSLTAYKEMLEELGGFVARESMIYINREGVVKVWVNQNLATNEFQFPYPTITEEEFIGSLLHQIFTRSISQEAKIYDYIKTGLINFAEVSLKLNYYLKKYELPMFIDISKEVFDTIIDSYEVKSRKRIHKSAGKQVTHQESSINKLKFLVAEDSPGCQGRVGKDYVKDYSKKVRAEPPTMQTISHQMASSRTHLIYSPHLISNQGQLQVNGRLPENFIQVNDNLAS